MKKKKPEIEFKGRRSRRDKDGKIKKKYPTERELVNLYAEKICRKLWGPKGFFWIDRDTATVRTKSGFDFFFMCEKGSVIVEAKKVNKEKVPHESEIQNLLSPCQKLTVEEVTSQNVYYYIFIFTEKYCHLYFRIKKYFFFDRTLLLSSL